MGVFCCSCKLKNKNRGLLVLGSLLTEDLFLPAAFVLFLAFLVFITILSFKLGKKSAAGGKLLEQAELNDRLKTLLEKKLADILGPIEGMLKTKTEADLFEFSKKLEKIIIAASASSQDQQKGMVRETQYLVANKFAKVQKELEEYRNSQLKKIDAQIYLIIFEASREVLGRSISRGEHEDLVRKALERAKKDRFFL